MSRGFASNYRIVLLATGLFVCFTGIAARLVCLHVIDRDELLRTIVRARHQMTLEMARRGDIRDVHGAILATSRPMILVAVDPMLVRPEDEEKLPQLAKLLDLPLADVHRVFTTKYRTVAAKPLIMPANAPSAPVDAPLAVKLNLAIAPSPAMGADDPGGEGAFGREVVSNNMTATASEKVAPDRPAGGDDDDDLDEASDQQGRRAIRWAKLSDHVSESTYADIQNLGIRSLCPPERRYSRVYPHEELASHIIGYANHEGRGVAGIEAYADFYLRGQNGWREGERDGRRRELAQFQTREIPRVDGYSVVLSIDSTVQDIIERELDRIARTFQPLRATIIVSNPRTGFILGMANYPTYDPNEYNHLRGPEMVRMRNVAVADVYEPGSVFKIVSVSGALEEGLVTPQSEFNCGIDHIEYKGRDLTLPREDHHFGLLSVAEIISHSSNRGAAQLAMELGDDRFEKYIRAFGFGSKLGFPVGGESPGIFAPHRKWNPLDITRIPMGQAIAATALQMHQAMSSIANDGVLLRPQVIWQVRDTSNTVVYQYGPAEIDRVVSARTARTVARLLQGVASPNGTAPEAAIKIDGVDFEVAGKTGTSEKYLPEVLPSGRVKLLPSKKHHVASFVGFFPASRPQVAISVIVDDADAHAPGGVAYGRTVAAPAFKSIGEKLITILHITPPNQPLRPEFVATAEGGRR